MKSTKYYAKYGIQKERLKSIKYMGKTLRIYKLTGGKDADKNDRGIVYRTYVGNDEIERGNTREQAIRFSKNYIKKMYTGK